MRNLAGVAVCRTAKRIKASRGKEKGAGDTFAKSDKRLLIKNCLIALLT